MPTAITQKKLAFENNREAQAIFPSANSTAAEIVAALEIKQPKAVLLIIGGADSIDEKVSSKLIQLFGRGIARAAAGLNALIIDGGTEAGVMQMMGRGVADRGFKSTLIGVAPLGLVSYPGSEGEGKTPLDPNHSHFVFVEGKEWGSETSVIFKLIGALKAPRLVLLAGGGAVSKDEVLQAVRQNLSLVVIEGSGGLADEIATAWQAKPELPDDPVMAEIIADGRIEFHLLTDSVQSAERLLVRALGDNVLMQAWKRFADYDFNAVLQQRRFNRLQNAIMAIGLLATALAVGKEFFTKGVDGPVGSPSWYIKYVLIVMPIVLTVLITAANKFKQGNKWLLLRAGAEAIKREIYRYRARAGDYKEVFNAPAAAAPEPPAQPPPPTPEQVLAQRVEDVSRRTMRTEVNSSSLIPYDNEKDFPPYVKDSGDDGFSVLTPDRYVQVRLGDQLGYYKRSAVKHERRLKLVQWSIYIIGGLGTLLAAINQQVWIALTTALGTALATYLSYQQTEDTLTTYNQAFTDLDNVKSWWTALPAEEQAKQENVDTLVKHTEEVLQSELDGSVQRMQNALAELRKDQVKAPETNDMSGTAEKAAAEKAAAEKGGDGGGGGDNAATDNATTDDATTDDAATDNAATDDAATDDAATDDAAGEQEGDGEQPPGD